MAEGSLKQICQQLLDLQLASEAQLTELQNDPDLTPEVLLSTLVKEGKITKFQASQIFANRGKGLLFGDYVVFDKLGAGGMGQVFKARHRRMKRVVALKVLPSHAVKSQQSVQRFQQEVEVAAQLNHPNIVTAYDSGEAHGLHYLAMEYVDGQDLSSYLSKQGTLTVAQAVNVVLQAAKGLEYAHAQGIVHRDIKPANLLVSRKSQVKILDMGLARFAHPFGETGEAREGLTESGQIMGTVDYMAPEQASDTRNADHRADIYSLGCTLYRLLTGNIPFPAETTVQRILAHREQPIPALQANGCQVPEALAQLYLGMMAKDPNERIDSMTKVVQTLEKLMAGKSEEESSIAVEGAAELKDFLRATKGSSSNSGSSSKTKVTIQSATTAGSASSSSSGKPQARSRRGLLLGAAAALVLIVVAVGVWFSRGSTASPSTPPVVAANSAASPTSQVTTPAAKTEAKVAPQSQAPPALPSSGASFVPAPTPPAKTESVPMPAPPVVATDNNAPTSADAVLTDLSKAPAAIKTPMAR